MPSDRLGELNQQTMTLKDKIQKKMVVKPVNCQSCGEQPGVCWINEQVALACDCGHRKVPEDALLEHDFMPEDVNWTVEEVDDR